MTEMSTKTLKRTLQKGLIDVKALEPKSFAEKIQKAKTIGYLVSVAATVIQKNELEKRLDELEKQLEGMSNAKNR